MLILHVSDTHLGAVPNNVLSRARDVYEAFKETIDIALRERVDVYIHTGDFFNMANPPPESYIVAYRGLKMLKEKGVKIIAIAGQHDLPKRYAMSPLSILKDVGVIDHVAIDSISIVNIEVGHESCRFVCIPYGLRHKIASLSIPRESRSVLMAHLLLKDLGIPSAEADVSLDMIPSGFSYIALGDYHNKTLLRHKSGTPVVYPGATEVHRVNEQGKKFVSLVDLSGSEASINFIEITSVRPWIVLTCDEVSRCINKIIEDSKSLASNRRKKPVVYISIEKIKTETLSRFLDELVEKGLVEHYIVTPAEQQEQDTGNVDIQGFAERLEYVDVSKILENLLKDKELADQVLALIKSPSKHTADVLVENLKNRIESIRDIESKLRQSLGNADSESRKSLNQYGQGVLRYTKA
uniref:DNA repair exonuclease n=1 Tax=Ignisphaera aggregans TaxID=334771 RepID=A0A7C2ZNP4_9CREN